MVAYFRKPRRVIPARPIKPAPKRNIVAGSGTGVGLPPGSFGVRRWGRGFHQHLAPRLPELSSQATAAAVESAKLSVWSELIGSLIEGPLRLTLKSEALANNALSAPELLSPERIGNPNAVVAALNTNIAHKANSFFITSSPFSPGCCC